LSRGDRDGGIQVREGVLQGLLDYPKVIVSLRDRVGTVGIRRVKLADVVS
jgi:hypothetical protein